MALNYSMTDHRKEIAPFVVSKPRIIMFEQDGKLTTHLYPRDDDTYEGYGLMIADIIRHAATYFSVEPDDINTWVQKELRKPTTDISRAS